MFRAEDVECLIDAGAGVEVGEHALDTIAGAAVNRTRERAQRRQH